MKCLIGVKKSMTQRFLENGTVIPMTVVWVNHCRLVGIRTPERDGYSALQLAYGETKRVKKPQKGLFRDLGNFRLVREFRLNKTQQPEIPAIGTEFTVLMFSPGDKVMVTGISKGRGFQGVVKRHKFHGSPASHGHKDQLRMPGAIGAGGVQNVKKGKRMAGHMGSQRVTTKNLEIIEVDQKRHEILIKGALPGARNSVVEIRSL